MLIKTASLDNNSRVFTYCSFIRRPRCIHWCIASSHGSCADDVFGIQVNHTPERNVFCVTRAFSPEQVCSLDSCVLDEKGKYNNVIDSRRRIDHNEKQQQKVSKGKFVLFLNLRFKLNGFCHFLHLNYLFLWDRIWKREKDLQNVAWKIHFRDIDFLVGKQVRSFMVCK